MSHLLSTSFLSLAAAGLLLAAGTSCRSSGSSGTPAAYPPVVSSDFGDMHNVSVCGPIWLGAMPSAEDLKLARRRGISINQLFGIEGNGEKAKNNAGEEPDREPTEA